MIISDEFVTEEDFFPFIRMASDRLHSLYACTHAREHKHMRTHTPVLSYLFLICFVELPWFHFFSQMAGEVILAMMAVIVTAVVYLLLSVRYPALHYNVWPCWMRFILYQTRSLCFSRQPLLLFSVVIANSTVLMHCVNQTNMNNSGASVSHNASSSLSHLS